MTLGVRIAPTAAARAKGLLQAIQYHHPPACSCHSNPNHQSQSHQGLSNARRRSFATPVDMTSQKEYAFEMAASSIRFGPGCTKEVGMDFKNMGAKKVCVVTDGNVAKLNAMKQVVKALSSEGVQFTVYERTMVEPKDSSIREAIDFSKSQQPDAFLAVGGGSVFANRPCAPGRICQQLGPSRGSNAHNRMLTRYPSSGRGLPITKPLFPLIAVPTTAGTGSETTGTAIFDLVSKKAKTGIAHRALKPTLGICDPLNTRTMPSAVHASSGLDVLCHALESWTAIPYTSRSPRPANPINRPAYQGANPISDIFSLQALRSTIRYLPRAARDPDDTEAQSEMLLAATLAGVGFGNAGVHLCHGMSYPISGQNKGYRHPGYAVPSPIIPHGVSVAVTAPAVFRFTGASNPERHLAAAECFGVDIGGKSKASAGEVLGEAIAEFLVGLGDQPRGLKALGFEQADVEDLVEGTVPQKRVLMLAPGLSEEVEEEREQLRGLFEGAMEY
ncbi:MAG: hypothetical protein Q9173_001960 [Seirophora scorigena]